MRILERYIAKQVIIATGLVLAVLVGLDTFMLFFAEMSDIGRAGYHLFKAFWYVLMQLPFDLYQLFPMAGFLGCLIGLGRLASQSELIVMRASGVSVMMITVAVIKAAIAMLLLVSIIGELVAPQLQRYAEHMKATALAREKNYLNLGGVWLRDQNEFIYLANIDGVDQVRNVTVFGFRGHELQSISRASVGSRLPDGTWLLHKVTQTELGDQQMTSHQLDALRINVKFDPLVLSMGRQSVDQLSIIGLQQSIQYRKRSGLDVEHYQLAFWQRVFQPLATVVMICLGVPFIFGSLRHASMGLRILIGITIGFLFYLLNQLLGPLAIVYQFSPTAAAMIPAVIFIVLCAILFRRIH